MCLLTLQTSLKVGVCDEDGDDDDNEDGDDDDNDDVEEEVDENDDVAVINDIKLSSSRHTVSV